MISEFDYFFYEWLIIYKKIDFEAFSKISNIEFNKLLDEFINFSKKLV